MNTLTLHFFDFSRTWKYIGFIQTMKLIPFQPFFRTKFLFYYRIDSLEVTNQLKKSCLRRLIFNPIRLSVNSFAAKNTQRDQRKKEKVFQSVTSHMINQIFLFKWFCFRLSTFKLLALNLGLHKKWALCQNHFKLDW